MIDWLIVVIDYGLISIKRGEKYKIPKNIIKLKNPKNLLDKYFLCIICILPMYSLCIIYVLFQCYCKP